MLLKLTDAIIERFHCVFFLHRFRSRLNKQTISTLLKKRFCSITGSTSLKIDSLLQEMSESCSLSEKPSRPHLFWCESHAKKFSLSLWNSDLEMNWTSNLFQCDTCVIVPHASWGVAKLSKTISSRKQYWLVVWVRERVAYQFFALILNFWHRTISCFWFRKNGHLQSRGSAAAWAWRRKWNGWKRKWSQKRRRAVQIVWHGARQEMDGNVFHGKHNLCHEWACNIMCDVRANVRVCTCHVRTCSVHNLSTTMFPWPSIPVFVLEKMNMEMKKHTSLHLRQKGPTTFAGSLHFFSSDTSVSTMIVIRRDNKPFLQLPTTHLPVNITIFVWRLVQNHTYRSQQPRSWRVQSTKRQNECSLDCHVDTCVVFQDDCPIVNKSLNGVGDENPQHSQQNHAKNVDFIIQSHQKFKSCTEMVSSDAHSWCSKPSSQTKKNFLW